MNRFFEPPAGSVETPPHLYARLIDAEPGEYALFDAVAMEDIHGAYASPDAGAPGSWRDHVERARIFAIEVNISDGTAAAQAWLDRNRELPLTRWYVIAARDDAAGEALIYDNIAAEGRPVRIDVSDASTPEADALSRVTSLSPHVVQDDAIEGALPTDEIDQVFVLDVGQGSAAALVTSDDNVVAYADLGAGVLRDTRTWPSAFTGLCLCHGPTVILSHWHYDHFEAANKFPAARSEVWIAPFQTLGAGPQSAMAAAVASAGTLLVWNGSGRLTSGSIVLERCTGPAGNQNRTGIAVWLTAPEGGDPVLLPGDAGYCDFTALTTPNDVVALAVAHHGGSAPGTPPAPSASGMRRAALSYGHGNRYKHPRPASLTALAGAGWTTGHPHGGIDDRRTEDRPGGTGGSGLGHVRIHWPGSAAKAFSCACGAPLDPTQ